MIRRISLLIIALFLTKSAFAEKVRSGEWWLDVSDSSLFTEAFTANQSGSTFGFICIASSNKCVYYVSPQTTCDEGSTSAVLINSDAGALYSTVKCTKLGDTYYSVIQETDSLHSAVMKSNEIGIAFPMKGGQFKVVRFSLVGANSAIRSAAEQAAAMVESRDQIL